MQIEVGSKIIGDNQPTFIIAEMAWGHDGSLEKAKKIIDHASDAGVDAINIHITSMNDYMVPHYTAGVGKSSSSSNTKPLFEYLSEINLNNNELTKLIEYAKSKNLMISALCNDMQSEKFASEFQPEIYALHPSCMAEEELIKKVAENQKPVILNVGGCTIGEIDRAIGWIKETNNSKICLLYGIQTYPTSIENAKIGYISTLKKTFGFPAGIADHTDGASELALVVPIAGIVAGANIIEKHVTHDRKLKGEDYEAALDKEGIIKLVGWIKKIEKSLKGSHVNQLSKDELFYRSVSMKKIVAKKDIKKGEIISEENICAKRSDEGLELDEKNNVIGRKTTIDIKENEGISLEKLI